MSLILNRSWAMPSRHTFTISPIKELIERYVVNPNNWFDPFAGENSPAGITNDLNPAKPTKYHLRADDFIDVLFGEFDGCLFDPPYSLRQMKECYDSIGMKMTKKDSNVFTRDVKRKAAKLIKPNGYAISFGWSSVGFGKNLGFKILEVLLVSHGGFHNDTIVTVEQKIFNPHPIEVDQPIIVKEVLQ